MIHQPLADLCRLVAKVEALLDKANIPATEAHPDRTVPAERTIPIEERIDRLTEAIERGCAGLQPRFEYHMHIGRSADGGRMNPYITAWFYSEADRDAFVAINRANLDDRDRNNDIVRKVRAALNEGRS